METANGGNVASTVHTVQNDTEQLSSGIIVSNVTAKWADVQTENTLENINLTVKPGRLVAIIGPVGAGKVYIYIHKYVKYVLNETRLVHRQFSRDRPFLERNVLSFLDVPIFIFVFPRPKVPFPSQNLLDDSSIL